MAFAAVISVLLIRGSLNYDPVLARSRNEKAVSAVELQAIQLSEDSIPGFLEIEGDGSKLFIGNDTGDKSVICVTASTGQVLWSCLADINANGDAVAPRWITRATSGTNLFVLNWYKPGIKVLNINEESQVAAIDLSEEPMMMAQGFVNGEAILMVTTMNGVHYFRENPFALLRSEAFPGTAPQKIAYDEASSTLFIPLFEDDLVVAHQLNWDGSSLSVNQIESATGDMPIACVPEPNGNLVAVVSTGDGKIRLHDKQTLAVEGTYDGLTNVSDAVYKDGKVVVTRYYDPSAGEGWRGDILIFDLATRQSVSTQLPDRYPSAIESTDIPGFVFVIDEGIYVGNGQNGPGALLKLNLTTAQVEEIHPLSGSNLWSAYDANAQKLFVSEPTAHSIRVFQLR